MRIESSANSKVKNLRFLIKDKSARQESGLYVLEGLNLVKDMPHGAQVTELYIKESGYAKLNFLEEKFSLEGIILPDRIFDGVADTVSPGGVIAVAKRPVQMPLSGDIVLLLCGVADAGNVGTIIRTAAARGIEDVVLADCAEAFSPKAIRAGMGGACYVNIIETNIAFALDLLEKYNIVSLDMGGKSIYSYKREGKIALAVGSEAHGLPQEIIDKSKHIISLPMVENSVESLNAAVSMGIAMYLID